MTAALVGIALGAIAVAIAIHQWRSLDDHSRSGRRGHPPDDGVAGERDIANAVSPLYRASSVDQLAVVTVQNYSDTGSSTQVALRNPNNGTLSALGGTTAVFNLCGLGPNCAIRGHAVT